MVKKACEWGMRGGEWGARSRDKGLLLHGVTGKGVSRKLWEAWGAGGGDLVDDLLDEDDLDVDAAGDVGEEFGDEVVSGGERPSGDDTSGGGGQVGLDAGYVEVGNFGVDG